MYGEYRDVPAHAASVPSPVLFSRPSFGGLPQKLFVTRGASPAQGPASRRRERAFRHDERITRALVQNPIRDTAQQSAAQAPPSARPHDDRDRAHSLRSRAGSPRPAGRA